MKLEAEAYIELGLNYEGRSGLGSAYADSLVLGGEPLEGFWLESGQKVLPVSYFIGLSQPNQQFLRSSSSLSRYQAQHYEARPTASPITFQSLLVWLLSRKLRYGAVSLV